jgi:hypothetical protein
MSWQTILLTLITVMCVPISAPSIPTEAEQISTKLLAPLATQPIKKKKPWQWYAKRAGLTAAGIATLIGIIAVARSRKQNTPPPQASPLQNLGTDSDTTHQTQPPAADAPVTTQHVPKAPPRPVYELLFEAEDAKTRAGNARKLFESLREIDPAVTTYKQKRDAAYFHLEVAQKNLVKAKAIAEKTDLPAAKTLADETTTITRELEAEVRSYIAKLDKQYNSISLHEKELQLPIAPLWTRATS